MHGDGAQVMVFETWRSETIIPLRVDSDDGAFGNGWHPGPEIPLEVDPHISPGRNTGVTSKLVGEVSERMT
jgi:hypothetical protein